MLFRSWGVGAREYERRADVWGLQPDAQMLLIFIIENRQGVENVRDIARTLVQSNIKAVLWAGSGDMSASYGRDPELLAAGLDSVIAAGREFGLPVGVNGTRDFMERYRQGVRLFFDLGPLRAATGPTITPEERRSVGR